MCQGVNPETNPAQLTPRGMRYQIALVGRRNAGKSSLLNMLVGQQVAIVSDVKGTTTDAVAKAYELQPIGAVTFFDTAGIDDVGMLGKQRVQATRNALYRADLALLVIDEQGLTEHDIQLVDEMTALKLPFVIVFNKMDKRVPATDDLSFCQLNNLPHISVSASKRYGTSQLKQLIAEYMPAELTAKANIAADLYPNGAHILCVVPIDTAAPTGRLILPQVQVLREALDNNAIATVVKESQLQQLLASLVNPPALIISDAQVIKQVASLVPESIPLTTFSTLFARFKGDLSPMVSGANTLDNLTDGSKILICEACSHNVQEDDIGRVKLPNWIRKYSGKDVSFDVLSGHDFPEDLEQYTLVIHCGACMFNRTEMLRRIRECERRNVPITNYGVAISKLQGVLPRIVGPLLTTNAKLCSQ